MGNVYSVGMPSPFEIPGSIFDICSSLKTNFEYRTRNNEGRGPALDQWGVYIPLACLHHSKFLVQYSKFVLLATLQDSRNRRDDICFCQRDFLSPGEILDFPDVLGKLVRAGDQGHLESTALGVLQLLTHFLGIRK